MNDTKTALDSIEAALNNVITGGAYTHPQTVEIAQDIFANVEEALALIPALREQLTPGEDVQEALDALDSIRSAFGISAFYDSYIKTIRKALQKPQAVDVEGLKKHRRSLLNTALIQLKFGEENADLATKFISEYIDLTIDNLHKQGYLTQPTEDKTS